MRENKLYFKLIILGGILICSFILFSDLGSKKNSSKIFLWAWERPENLNFIDGKKIGVVFYAGNITFSNSKTIFRPRFQPLLIDSKISPIAVIRIESRQKGSQLNKDQLSQAVDLIVKTCSRNKISGCQIDFDANSLEINFYKELISKVRSNLSRSIPLSITALVSWCHSGSWLKDLPIDEAIPMFFSLGKDEYIIRNNLVGESFMKEEKCQKSIGISVNEPLPSSSYLKNREIYIFNPSSWTPKDFADIIKLIEEK